VKEHLTVMYRQYPDALADELEMLFEPCSDATYAVLHNVTMQRIMDLCGEEVTVDGGHGVEPKKETVLKCKSKLAKALAEAVIKYMVAK